MMHRMTKTATKPGEHNYSPYADICGKYFSCNYYVFVPFSKIKDKDISSEFKHLCEVLPDHPSSKEDGLFLLKEHRDERFPKAVLVIHHFEGNNGKEIPGIIHVMNSFEYTFGAKGWAIELLDAFGEKLVVSFFHVDCDVAKAIQRGVDRMSFSKRWV